MSASDASYNAFYPIAINGLNNLVNAIDSTKKTSLKNFGRSELMGDVYIDNNAKLVIGKSIDASNNYYLDISGNSCFRNDIIVGNKNILSKVQTINLATTLTFGSSEYVCISSSFPNNGSITLPLVSSLSQIGTKFTFFYGSANYPLVYLSGNTSQQIVDNVNGASSNSVVINVFKPFVELVCIDISGVCWSQINGIYDYNDFGNIGQDNTWVANNYFVTPSTTDNSTKVATTQYVKNNLSSYALLSSPGFTGNPTVPTQLSTDNSTRIASTAYVKGNLSSYLLNSDASSNYLKIIDASNNYQKISGMSSYLTSANASSTYQTIAGMSSYVLQSYLDANYNTTAYINNNYANLNTQNTLYGSLSLYGAVNVRNNMSVLNSKSFTITAGSNFNMDSGSTANLNGTVNISGSTNFTSVPKINSVNIATINDLPNTSVIYAPSFRSNTQSAGDMICGFQSNNGDSRFEMYDEGTGLTPNCAVIKTLAGNGIGIQGYYGPINFFCGTTLISQITPSGLYVNGDASCNTINGISNSTFQYINSLTSNCQTQLNSKASTTANNSFSGTQTYNSSCSFTSSATFSSLPSMASAITTSALDNLITKRIANSLYCGIQNPSIISPTIQMLASFIPSGETICTFSDGSTDSILIRNSGYGLTPNAMCIDTGNTNGLCMNSNTASSGINFFIAKTLIGQILSTGLSISNISFTGTLNTISTTTLSYISTLTSNAQTQISGILNGTNGFGALKFNNKNYVCSNGLITGAITLTYPVNEMYSINVTTAITITLPTISLSNVGTRIIFRRTGGTTTVAVSFIGNGTQSVYNQTNTGGVTAQALMPSGSYSVTLCAIYQTSTSTFGWYQI